MKTLVFLPAMCVAIIALGQDKDCDTLEKCEQARKANPNSSLVHFRIGESFFQEKNYQSAANEFRRSLTGDGEPKWTEVWAHINLGRIFDITKQRRRAINEYKQAQRTGDNTRGAQDEAAKYLQTPFRGDEE